jgi:acyl carrier protein
MLYELQIIFREVFDDPTLQISPELSTGNFPDWDSVAMVQIVLATESQFGMRFTTNEVASIKSVADILRLLEVHRT